MLKKPSTARQINVVNGSIDLYGRFEFLIGEYKSKLAEAEKKAHEPGTNWVCKW